MDKNKAFPLIGFSGRGQWIGTQSMSAWLQVPSAWQILVAGLPSLTWYPGLQVMEAWHLKLVHSGFTSACWEEVGVPQLRG